MMDNNVIFDAIETAKDGLETVMDQAHRLLNELPDELTEDGTATMIYLNRIYFGSNSVKQLLEAALGLSESEILTEIGKIEEQKDYLQRIEVAISKDKI